jgi:hypothetical protein
MARRRVVAGLAVLVGIALTVFALWPCGPRPGGETFELVRVGMTRSEVEAAVGGPAGNYCGRQEIPLLVSGITDLPERWIAHDSNLVVYFDDSAVACAVYVSDPSPDNRSPARRLRDRLGF